MMGLAEKMFSRTATSCPIRGDCFTVTNDRYLKSLFENDWEVFVIRHNNEAGKFDWFTLCCEAARSQCGTNC